MKILAYLLASALLLTGCQTPTTVRPVYGPTNPSPSKAATSTPRYYCSIIGLRPEKEAEYRKLHASVWPEVRAAIRKANIRDYNIYIEVLNGKKYLVSHFEYVGKDPDKDFALIAKDPTTKNKWWPLTDACQVVLRGTPSGQQWLPVEQVMHLD